MRIQAFIPLPVNIYFIMLFLIFRYFLLTITVCHAQTFTRITNGPVVNSPADSRSVNWIDFNNDGLIDLMITNGPSGGQNNMLYINNGSGVFTPVTVDTIVLDHAPSDGASWADTDNDGDLDCFVANYYDLDNLFYNNNGNGTFVKNSAAVIGNDAGFSETGAWGDYDNDGLVDLYVTNSGSTPIKKKNYLYHNDGNNTFSKIIPGAMVTDAFLSRCINWTDIDNDNDPDLFVTNENNENENIYRNDGGGVFVKLTAGILLNSGGKTMSSSWGDYDNDGDLDVFLANDQANNALFRNDGSFNFTKIFQDTVSKSGGNSFSSSWSDIDNDGDLDLFVTNSFWTLTKQINFLYLNNNNGTFSRIGNTVPATDSSWSYGCAFGDYDNDGFEDLAVATVRFNGIDESDFLYHNDGNSNTWITIKLTGTVTNKSAIGTKIRVKAIINGLPVWQMREISAQTSYCGQNDLRAHFGIGNAPVIDSIMVEWRSGITEFYTQLSTGQFIEITEGQGVSGIDNLIALKQNEIIIYPNPNTEKITLSIPGRPFKPGDCIIIQNTNGDTICELKPNFFADDYEIQLQQIGVTTKGVYFIKVVNGKDTFQGRFMKL